MKRLLIATSVTCLIIGSLLWFGFSHNSKHGSQPFIPQETTVRNTAPTTILDATPVTETPSAPVDPAPSSTLFGIDSSHYPAGMVNSPHFNSPAGDSNTWVVNFSYTSPSADNSVIVRVIDVVSGNPVNFVILSNPSASGQFSFLEAYHANPVYIEVTAGTWSLSVVDITGTSVAQYPLVNTQTLNDLYCVKNKAGACSSNP